MSTLTFILGMTVLGIFIVTAAFILSGSVTAAARSIKDTEPQTLQQPTLSFLTEYDAADYLGVSLNELDYMRSQELLDGSFVAITSLEQSGEEEYTDIIDGVEVVKTRPIMVHVTRFLYNRELLDKKMAEVIKSGRHINPSKRNAPKNAQNSGQKPPYGKKNNIGSENKQNGNNNGKQNGGGKQYSQKPENQKPDNQRPEKQNRPEKKQNYGGEAFNDVIEITDVKKEHKG